MKRKSDFNRPKRIKKEEFNSKEINPFKSNWKFPVLMSDDRFLLPENDKRNSKTVFYATPEEAKSISINQFHPSFVDSTCVKLFKEATDGYISGLWKMKSSVHTLLFWVLYHLEYGKDKVFINKQEIQNKTGLSKTTLYAALKELKEKDILIKSKDKDYFFFNVQYFFLGSRGNYFPDHTVSIHGNLEASKDIFNVKHRDRIEKRIAKLNIPPKDHPTKNDDPF